MHYHCYQSKIIFATSVLVFTRRNDLSSFQRSHWSPIHILLLPNLAFDSLFRCFLPESVNLFFGPRFELFFHWQQSQYACVAFKFNRGRMNTENVRGILVGIIAWQDIIFATCFQGRIQDFKLGGAHLIFLLGYFVWKITILPQATGHLLHSKNICPPPLRIVWMKQMPVDFTPKNHMFSNFKGGRVRLHPLDPPLVSPVSI